MSQYELFDDFEEIVIFRPYFTLKNGRRIYASQFGKRAFPIKVRVPKKKT